MDSEQELREFQREYLDFLDDDVRHFQICIDIYQYVCKVIVNGTVVSTMVQWLVQWYPCRLIDQPYILKL